MVEKPHDPKASFHLNKVIDELKEYTDEFLPAWKKRSEDTHLQDSVQQWMEYHYDEYGTATELAENAAWEFDKDYWLDDETHWVWDLALEHFDEPLMRIPPCMGQDKDAAGVKPCDVHRMKKRVRVEEDEDEDEYKDMDDLELIKHLFEKGEYEKLDRLFFDKFTAAGSRKVIAQRLDEEKRKLETYIEAQPLPEEQKSGWLQSIRNAFDFTELKEIWDQLFGRVEEVPQPTEQRWEDTSPEDYGMIELSTLKKKVVFDNDTIFTVDTADTYAKRATGLEAYDTLDDNSGMLFPFDPPDHAIFHMGRVKYPIDILFMMKDELGEGLKVAKIIHEVQPGSYDQWSNANTDCVLEVSGGLCKKHGIDIGSTCRVLEEVKNET